MPSVQIKELIQFLTILPKIPNEETLSRSFFGQPL